MVSREEAIQLLEAARQVRSRSYSPYSHFPVGAALLDEGGGVHAGTNVENASYGLATCAERSAISRAVSEGARSFRAIAVVGPDDDAATMPCGSCRQVLREFAPDLSVIVAAPGGGYSIRPLGDLLPESFGPESLERGRHDG